MTLGTHCPTCQNSLRAEAKFCDECGRRISGGQAVSPRTERRIVSVLFGDLQGFTTISANRDPEDVRDLLSEYFEVARTVIARHGGTIEKFIGDAVMAVWGTPTAHEDDPERAVMAALELAAAVGAIAIGSDESLHLRVGIVTGEAVVTLGAVGQGMVAGDTVNTASRVQTTAAPDTVLVDDATQQATESVVTYQDAGTHHLKGKDEPIHLWQALDVVPRRQGVQPPFVGRATELALIQEQFQVAMQTRCPELISVVGVAGAGKTRLAFEFEQWVAQFGHPVRWHVGHAPPPGEGASLAPLIEIIASVVGVTRSDGHDTIAQRVADVLEGTIDDERYRQWIVARVCNLFVRDTANAFPLQEVLVACGKIIEGAAADCRTVLVIEELQWAEPAVFGLLSGLAAPSTNLPLFIMTLGRPEVLTARPDWGTGDHARSILLGGLADEDVRDLIAALAPGLPHELTSAISGQAEGVPLYAVETLRMLAAQGRLLIDENHYGVVGDISDVEIPQSLQLLLGARLDALPADERDVLLALSVLGLRFSPALLGSLQRVPGDLGAIVASLEGQGIISRGDGKSPDSTPYYFAQGLLHTVAYGRLSKRSRLAQHLRTARFVEAELATFTPEVAANHYLAARDLAPQSNEATEGLRSTAAKAAASAASVGAAGDAERYYRVAVEVSDDEAERAHLLMNAAEMARRTAGFERAAEYGDQGIALALAAGDMALARRIKLERTLSLHGMGMRETANELALELCDEFPPMSTDPVRCEVTRRVAMFLGSAGDLVRANEFSDQACELAAWNGDIGLRGESLVVRSMVLTQRGRKEESLAAVHLGDALLAQTDNFTQHSLAFLTEAQCHAEFDDLTSFQTPFNRAEDLIKRTGHLGLRFSLRVTLTAVQYRRGRWDEALEAHASLNLPGPTAFLDSSPWAARIHSHRGNAAEADRCLAAEPVNRETIRPDVLIYPLARAVIALDRDDWPSAYDAGSSLFRSLRNSGLITETSESYFVASMAARQMGDWEAVETLLALAGDEWPGRRTASFAATVSLERAHLLMHRGDMAGADGAFRDAIDGFRQADRPYHLAISLVGYAALLEAIAEHHRHAVARDEAITLLHGVGAAVELRRLGVDDMVLRLRTA